MRIVIAGLSELGKQRQHVLGKNCVASVDAHDPLATHASIQEVSVDSYDAILVCAGDKFSSTRYGLVNGKHVLVERPFVTDELSDLYRLAATNKVCLYIANPYRFDKNFLQVNKLLSNQLLGKVYNCNVYCVDNLTHNILLDYGSTLLDIMCFWFGDGVSKANFTILRKKYFESEIANHIIFGDLVAELGIMVEMNALARTKLLHFKIVAQKASIDLKVDANGHVVLEYSCGDGQDTSISKYANALVLEHDFFVTNCASGTFGQHSKLEQWNNNEVGRLLREEIFVA